MPGCWLQWWPVDFRWPLKAGLFGISVEAWDISPRAGQAQASSKYQRQKTFQLEKRNAKSENILKEKRLNFAWGSRPNHASSFKNLSQHVSCRPVHLGYGFDQTRRFFQRTTGKKDDLFTDICSKRIGYWSRAMLITEAVRRWQASGSWCSASSPDWFRTTGPRKVILFGFILRRHFNTDEALFNKFRGFAWIVTMPSGTFAKTHTSGISTKLMGFSI